MIARALAEYDGDVRAEWARIRVEPTKWRCSPWGDEGGGFWVVAVDDARVLWFNDIEDGFNWSGFSERGTIGEYGCSQDDFAQILERIARIRSARTWTRLRETEVPPELAAPGTIVKRQTTYWEVRAADGAVFRIHFRGKVEVAFTSAECTGVELSTRHPLLALYDEPSRSLYISGTPIDPPTLVDRLDRLIREGSRGWRGLADHSGGRDHVERLLRAGYGLLMSAPESVCAVVAAALEDAAVRTSILDGAPARPGNRLLLLGASYLIAREFTFERRPESAR